MAREVPSRSRWLPSLLGLCALSVVGFATGFAAGGLWDGPGLVLQKLLGSGQELAWGPDARLREELERVSRESAPAAVAAAPPAIETEAAAEAPAAAKLALAEPPAGKAGRSEPAKRDTPAVSARPPAGRLSIQVGAFGESGGAEKLVQRLRSAGFPAYVAVGAGEGARWRVRVGPYPSREKADEVAIRLKQSEKLPTWVLDEDAGNG
jgi:cell division septation protein DedD